jgi:DegV family protein with EDD domain
MAKVVLVTDSSGYIPQELIDRYKIRVAPLVLIWGKESFLDGVDIQPDEFYRRLKTAKVMPSTSQATPLTMREIFGRILNEGDEVLGIFIGSELSGTLASANQARDELGKEKIELVDSTSIAMAMGFQVLAAARALEKGAKLQEAAEAARQTISHTGVVFTLDTLEFLQRGGRIGAASRYLGSALNMKPILEIRGGRDEPIERIRTKSKALDRVLDIIGERINGQTPVRLSTIHALAEEEAKQLLEKAVNRFHPVEAYMAVASPVVGTHAGPGTVGLAFCAGI